MGLEPYEDTRGSVSVLAASALSGGGGSWGSQGPSSVTTHTHTPGPEGREAGGVGLHSSYLMDQSLNSWKTVLQNPIASLLTLTLGGSSPLPILTGNVLEQKFWGVDLSHEPRTWFNFHIATKLEETTSC